MNMIALIKNYSEEIYIVESTEDPLEDRPEDPLEDHLEDPLVDPFGDRLEDPLEDRLEDPRLLEDCKHSSNHRL
jgi:hypothetical protein